MTGERRGRDHRWAHQMRAAARALTAFEIAVGAGCATLARCEDVVIHGEAHGAAGLPPFEAGVDEYLVEALGLGRAAHAR